MQENRKEIPRKSKFIIEFVIYLLFALGPLTGNVILVLFGVLSTEFSVSIDAIPIAIPAFMFPFAITQLFSGAISDIKGRFQVILFGLIIFGIGMTIAAISFSLEMYVVSNVLGGIGFGFVNPVLIALLADITSGRNIPAKMGYLGAVANLGVGFGPIIAGQMVVLGWRYLYLIFIIIILIGFTIIISVKNTSQKSNQKSGMRVFFKHISQEIRRKVVILLIFSAFLVTQTYLAIITWTSISFTGKIPPNIAGLVVGSAGITGAITGVIFGNIIKFKGVKIAIIMGLIFLFISILTFLLLGNDPKWSEIRILVFTTIGLVFTGAAGGTLLPSIMYYSQTLSKYRRGALAGLTTAGQFIGIALVPIMYALIYLHGGIQAVYFTVLLISFLLVLVIVILYILAKKVDNPKEGL
ncbi:MAG: MFS transporter [Promethearchaeota archaeon]